MALRGNPKGSAGFARWWQEYTGVDRGGRRWRGSAREEVDVGRGSSGEPADSVTGKSGGGATREAIDPERKVAARRWAEPIRRIFEVDPLVCPRCQAEPKIVSFITERPTTRRILERMSRPRLPVSPPSARAGGGTGR
jgi:hypothetical protein